MIFTFGFGQTCGCGRSLSNCFTELPTTERMFELWGVQWAHQYDVDAEAVTSRWALHRIVTDEQNPACRCGGTGRDVSLTLGQSERQP